MTREEMNPNVERRFWGYTLLDDGCWQWTGARFKTGYGRLQVSGKSVSAHRLSWLLNNGPISDSLCVLHQCDNRLCVRPDHLFLGTKAENNADRNAKGRSCSGDSHPFRARPELVMRGETHPRAKLNNQDVRAIRLMKRQGYSCRFLARQFSVDPTTISRISAGNSRKDA